MTEKSNLKNFILELFFPASCLGCGKQGDWLCEDCFSLIEISPFQFCPFCQKPVRVFSEGLCPKHRNKNLNGLYSATSYNQKLVKLLLKNFKYEPFAKALAKPLSSLIIAYFLSAKKEDVFNSADSLLFPVPLTKKRERWRGFNQSAEICRIVAGFFKVPYQFNNLIKIKKTQPQVELKKEEREKNIQGAFLLKNPQDVLGKKIFLIDDVFTTGSTMEEIARVLKQAGAQEVWGVAVAREPLSD